MHARWKQDEVLADITDLLRAAALPADSGRVGGQVMRSWPACRSSS
jgi:hypothetical protein